ncbi:EAL domain, c-di-GMP-specific phosphodiesterase class I (or its enzymatically inactive variant) [Pseudomonas saponiphila]|uniref:EAL domain, c-di-GMP-specific phosphodiesterase class I (Or its enzymatically inactive variant) n=1 Tax=Pseudomonas saponiphila TaxID=556534 RepID=A0A1H4MKX9_9PSED|nr:EAL domain-containing response regulator [Pseudomonas saponiphila]SEB83623.1 EAL domain, c-di-GMP-specific phosphodiesterase class I (or its enzymatically inactive variant) [Pseudomonas saponiphila]
MSVPKTLRVLVLDDHPMHCMQARQLLLQAGFGPVDSALDARQALAMLHRQVYDLVLVDLHMPEMDGVQFIHALTGVEQVPILAIVSSCSRRLRNSVSLMAKEQGLAVLGTFPKPLQAAHVEQIGTIIGNRQAHGIAPRPEHAAVFDRQLLERAIERRELKARFQPRRSLSSGRIVGAEALVRWDSPSFGLLMPDSFLASISRCQLDHQLLLLMLDDAIQAQQHWQRLGYRLKVSVNLPTGLLDDPGLPDQLQRLTVAAGLSTSDLCFELLETERPLSPGQYHMGASRLRLKGFGLAQDDFGMGYSSMYALISTPFTEMKIDRHFVHGAAADDARAAALVAAVQLGRQLGLEVVAEGVESARDLEFLRLIGCDSAQGYLISAALELDAFTQLLGCSVTPHFSSPTRPVSPHPCQTSRYDALHKTSDD